MRDNDGSSLRLYSGGLLSKWGFNDGDKPEAVYDYCETHGVSYLGLDWHATLVKVVRLYLLPALDQSVEVYEIETIHNPIRARTVNGEKCWSEADINPSVVLTPEYVEVPIARIIDLAVWREADGS